MPSVVVDASVVVALYVEEPASVSARDALITALAGGARLHAPDLLLIEAANAFWKRVSREELDSQDAIAAIEDLSNVSDITLHRLEGDLVVPALSIALSEGLTAYDAAYVALASHLEAVLVSCDRKLIPGAEKAGIRSVQPQDLARELAKA